jgi:glycoprotein-N-acetylgalactosamine 3-beta-galactosyltransferase
VPYGLPEYIITSPEPNGVSKGNILCGVYTYHKMDCRIKGVSERWGWRCDGFLPVSTVTIDDPAIRGYGSVDVPHHGPEMYNNMWQKTRSILAYMYDNYFDDYEDDTH